MHISCIEIKNTAAFVIITCKMSYKIQRKVKHSSKVQTSSQLGGGGFIYCINVQMN